MSAAIATVLLHPSDNYSAGAFVKNPLFLVNNFKHQQFITFFIICNICQIKIILPCMPRFIQVCPVPDESVQTALCIRMFAERKP